MFKKFTNDFGRDFQEELETTIDTLNANTNVVNQTLNTEKTRLDGRIDNLIITSGDSSAEVADARGGEPTLGGRLNNITSDLAQNKYYTPVEKFGAKGDYYLPDGSVNPSPTDDTLAIQSALDSAKRDIILTGRYLVNGTIKPLIAQHVIINGELITTNINNTIIKVEQFDVIIDGVGKLTGSGRLSGGSSSGIVTTSKSTKVKGLKATGFSNVGVGTGLGAEKAKFDDIEAWDNKSGVSIYRSKSSRASRCDCYENGIGANGGGIVVTAIENAEVQNFDVSNNNTSNNYASGISLNNVTRGVVSTNTSENNGGGVLGQASGIVALLNPSGASLLDLTLSNNNTNRNTDHGIVVQNNKDHTSLITGITATGNTASSNFKCGMRFVNGIDSATVANNTCNNNGSATSATGYRHGIMLADRTSKSSITGNTCSSNYEDGIRVTDESIDFTDAGSSENLLSNNICRNNAGYGVNIHTKSVASSANRIKSNTLRGNTLGEYNNTGSYTEIEGNRYTFDRIQGTVALVDGTVTINTAEVRTGDRIVLSVITPGGTQGALFVSAIVNGTSFTVKSTSATDTSSFAWRIDH